MHVWNGEKWVFFWGNWERKIQTIVGEQNEHSKLKTHNSERDKKKKNKSKIGQDKEKKENK